jgi:uncharacterized membrane protein
MWVNPASKLGRWLHWLFEASLVIKGLLAGGESLGGLGLLFTPNLTVLTFVGWLLKNHLTDDPHADLAQVVHGLAGSFTVVDQHFYALYLLGHGAIKFLMVLMLARRILWAYPGAMALLAGFVAYQFHEFLGAGHLGFLVLSVLDAFMIVLVWREWNVLRLKVATA